MLVSSVYHSVLHSLVNVLVLVLVLYVTTVTYEAIHVVSIIVKSRLADGRYAANMELRIT